MCAPLSESLYVPDGGDLYHTINSLVIADPLNIQDAGVSTVMVIFNSR